MPAKIASFTWGKKKGRSAVNKFFKDRQYLPDVGPDVRNKSISGLFAHARNRARNKIQAAWSLPGIVATRASLHETLEAHEDCGELVLSQEARDDATAIVASLPSGYPSFSFAEGAGYINEKGEHDSVKAWQKQNKTSSAMKLFNLIPADFDPEQVEASSNGLTSIQKAIEKRHDKYMILGKPDITSLYDNNGSALSAFRVEKYSAEAADASNHLYLGQKLTNSVGNLTLSERVETQISKKKFNASCTQIFLQGSKVAIPLAYNGPQVNWNESHCNDSPIFTACSFCDAAAAWQAEAVHMPAWYLCTSPLCKKSLIARLANM